MILLLALGCTGLPQETVDELALGAPYEVAFEEATGQGPFHYRAGRDGFVALAARSERGSLRLGARTSGGARVAVVSEFQHASLSWLEVEVQAGLSVAFTVTPERPELSGTVELRVFEAPETEATREAASFVDDSTGEIRALLADGDRETVLEIASVVLEELQAMEPEATSQRVAAALYGLGLAMRSVDPGLAVRAWRGAHERWTSFLPDEHPRLIGLWAVFALALSETGALHEALAVQSRAVEARARFQEPEDSTYLTARGNLSYVYFLLADYRAALPIDLELHEIYTRTLPEGNETRRNAQRALAATAKNVGDHATALELEESLLALELRILQPGDIDLSSTRGNLAVTLKELGDLDAALELEEQVVDALSRSLPDDHPQLQWARSNLAVTLRLKGDPATARVLEEKVFAVRSKSLPPAHPHLQMTRQNLASTLLDLGEWDAAEELAREALEIYERTFPAGHPRLQSARTNLGAAMYAQGRHANAIALFRRALADVDNALSPEHGDAWMARRNLSLALSRTEKKAEAARIASELTASLTNEIRRWTRTRSPREVETRVESFAPEIAVVLSVATRTDSDSADALRRLAVPLIESTRGIGLRSAGLFRKIAQDASARALREEIEGANRELAQLAQGATDALALTRVRMRREELQRDLLRSLADVHLDEIEPTVERLAAALSKDEASVGYWRYALAGLDAKTAPDLQERWDRLLVTVIRANGELHWLDLGPVEPVRDAVREWRAAVGVSSTPSTAADEHKSGERLRALVLDPVRRVLEKETRWIVALDDALHLVPLDALPLEEGFVGDQLRISLQPNLLHLPERAPRLPSEPSLLVLGGVDYDGAAQPAEAAHATEAAAVSAPRLRGASAHWIGEDARRFAPLPAAQAEVAAIRDLWLGEEAKQPIVLVGAAATREALEGAAPGATHLHLATHGFFAPVRSTSAAATRPLDAHLMLGSFQDVARRVHGTSPMLLCGLALAGANREPDAYGRVPGLLTAEELAGLDLDACELAVLSACDTNVGVQRRGQGVASLQKALHAAGARSAITTLWKVDDDAARRLMTEFYRRLWREKQPKWRALWEAKRTLWADRVPMRHWAGWVLTGDDG